MFVVWLIATGEADSFGTILADPMPPQYSVRLLSDDEAQMLADGTGIWDRQQLAIVPRPPEPEEPQP